MFIDNLSTHYRLEFDYRLVIDHLSTWYRPINLYRLVIDLLSTKICLSTYYRPVIDLLSTRKVIPTTLIFHYKLIAKFFLDKQTTLLQVPASEEEIKLQFLLKSILNRTIVLHSKMTMIQKAFAILTRQRLLCNHWFVFSNWKLITKVFSVHFFGQSLSILFREETFNNCWFHRLFGRASERCYSATN